MHFVRTCFEKEYDFFFTSIDVGHGRLTTPPPPKSICVETAEEKGMRYIQCIELNINMNIFKNR